MTLIALEWFLPGMGANVIVQSCSASERAPAETAFEWFLIDVNNYVFSQLGWPWERGRTMPALVWTIRGLQPRTKSTVGTK